MHIYNSLVDENEEHKMRMIKVFGKNIKNLRLEKQLTQEQVGEMASINSKYLGEVERGEKNPTALVIYKLSRALKVSVAEILSDGNYLLKENNMLREVERLFAGKEKQDIQKAIDLLAIFFRE